LEYIDVVFIIVPFCWFLLKHLVRSEPLNENRGWSAPSRTTDKAKDECEVLWNDDWPNTASTLPPTDPTLTALVLSSSFVCDFDPLISPFEPPRFSVRFFSHNYKHTLWNFCMMGMSALSLHVIARYRIEDFLSLIMSPVTYWCRVYFSLLRQFLPCMHASVRPSSHASIRFSSAYLLCSAPFFISVYIPVCLM